MKSCDCSSAAEWQYSVSMVERKRDRALTVRMLEIELDMLAALAEQEGVSVSEWIRNTIRREHVLTFTAKKPKRPNPKR